MDNRDLDDVVERALERDASRMPSFTDRPNDRLIGMLAASTAARGVWTAFGVKLTMLGAGAALIGSAWFFIARSPSHSPITTEDSSPAVRPSAPAVQPAAVPTTQPVHKEAITQKLSSHGHRITKPDVPMKLDDADRPNPPIYTEPGLHTKPSR